MKRTTITFRVTLWYTLLMALLGCAALGLLFYAGAQSARASTRSLMAEMAAGAETEFRVRDGALEVDNDLEAFRDGVYLSVYDGAGVPLYGMVPRAFDNAAVFEDGVLRTVVSSGVRWQLYDVRVPVDGVGDVWVRAVAREDTADAALSQLEKLALVAMPAFIALAAAGGWFITRRAFAPVRRIAQTARDIGESNDLSRRIALEQGRDEIHQLAAEFDRMFERLEQAFENEKRFTADASHELRTPVAVIISQCEYALAHTHTEQEARAALEDVLAQARRMAALLSQLLLLARADQGREAIALETVDLSMAAQAVAEQLAESAALRNIAVHTDIEPDVCVEGDETLLTRMLINLVENAVKYGREGGWVRVTLRRQGEAAVGCVADNGEGIAPGDRENIWKRFWRADAARSAGGAGLGLSMVRWIVQAHGGVITVDSAPGEGSAFTFTLPCRRKKE